NGQWTQTKSRIDTYYVKDEGMHLDTVLLTEFGPVYQKLLSRSGDAKHIAFHWLGADASDQLKGIYYLNRAIDLKSFSQAIAYLDCPVLNWAFASTKGDIAIWHQGKIPHRKKEQGKFVMDASKSEIPSGTIPDNSCPHIINPERNFVSSANQAPTDEDYPWYYPGVNYQGMNHSRNKRINELLDTMSSITPEDMMKMQLDNLNVLARKGLPLLLAYIDPDSLDEGSAEIYNILSTWNYRYDNEEEAPFIFKTFSEDLYNSLWDELLRSKYRFKPPSMFITFDIIEKDSTFALYDVEGTIRKETIKDLVQASFRSLVIKISNLRGNSNVKWKHVHQTHLNHIAKIPALGVSGIQPGGTSKAINATRETFGPAWRMVVSLEDKPRAWIVYPGGQSGHPGSAYYDNMIPLWEQGGYQEVTFITDPTYTSDHIQTQQLNQ
ncbi:MAG: penicillin acylase family protein, partial [Bacteroidetes bacterium]|nr:penicillin acylase family protein [Bacteroidota bacterium]